MNADILNYIFQYKYPNCKSWKVLLNSDFFNLGLYENVLTHDLEFLQNSLAIQLCISLSMYPLPSIYLYIYLTKADVHIANQNGTQTLGYLSSATQ